MKIHTLRRSVPYAWLLFCIALAPLLSPTFSAQAASPKADKWLAAQADLASILNADGTLRIDGTTQGTYSAAGWQLAAGANGRLRFTQTQAAPPYRPVEPWRPNWQATNIGSPSL